jgi:hypothetical protein
MRLRRGRGEQPDPAEEAVTSELGWVKVDVDLRQWIPLALAFPDGYDLDLWATTTATAWLAQWEPPVESPDVERLATMIRAIHKSADAHLQCHQIWIYLPDWFTTPLPVCIAIWRQSGERRRRLRLLTGADDKSCTPKPRVTKVATERLGTGLRVLRQRAQRDKRATGRHAGLRIPRRGARDRPPGVRLRIGPASVDGRRRRDQAPG